MCVWVCWVLDLYGFIGVDQFYFVLELVVGEFDWCGFDYEINIYFCCVLCSCWQIGLECDLLEIFDVFVVVGGFVVVWYWVVVQLVEQMGLQFGFVCCVQFFDYVGQEYDLGGGYVDGFDDGVVVVGFMFVVYFGIELV